MFFRNNNRTQPVAEPVRKFQTTESRAASDTIREAERLIASEQYDLALQRLAVIKESHPENKYVIAIIDRIGHLKVAKEKNEFREKSRYLEVTVGSKFTTGIRDTQFEKSDIDRLTHNAELYLKQGLLNKAFEVLMQAYLIDPLHPAVLNCEKQILPYWERAREMKQ